MSNEVTTTMEEINLYDLMRFYARKWQTILTAVMIGAIIGVIYTFFVQQPQYKSTATLLVVGTERTSSQESVAINNYVELFKSRRVLETVIAEKSYDRSYIQLADSTTAENVKNTDIINVSITTPSPKTSKDLLETAIRTFRRESKTLYSDGAVKINVVDVADAPTDPTNVKPIQQISLATVASVALAIIVLFFIYDYRASNPTPTKKTAVVKKQSSVLNAAKNIARKVKALIKELISKFATPAKKPVVIAKTTKKSVTKSKKTAAKK